MLAYQNDTIAALATPPGRGGIAIVRVSGENARAYFEALFRPAGRQQVESHRLLYGHLYDADGAMLDECMAVLMLAPRTYTREDVAEFHLHGGDQIAREALAALYRLGARPAEPGEFTRRAFLNGRVDLSRAEAVMDVIGAQGEQAARAALRQLNGGASAFIRDAQQRLTDLLAGVAAALDYPEEIEEAEAAGRLMFYGQGAGGGEVDAETLAEECRLLATEAAQAPAHFFLHRDFQSRNIMVSGGRLRLVDFQGMRPGPPAYDLASLLADPYVALPRRLQERLEELYRRAAERTLGISPRAFSESYVSVRLCNCHIRLPFCCLHVRCSNQ